MKACPYCSEEILPTAIKCKHCGEFLDGRESKPAKSPGKPICNSCNGQLAASRRTSAGGCMLVLLSVVAFAFSWPLGLIMFLVALTTVQKGVYVCRGCGAVSPRQIGMRDLLAIPAGVLVIVGPMAAVFIYNSQPQPAPAPAPQQPPAKPPRIEDHGQLDADQMTPEEWRALSPEEKKRARALARQRQGF